MTRSLILMAVLGLALAPVARASAEQVPADMEAKFQQDAEKSCNYDLDHDRFGSYGTMEECISDRSAKSERAFLTHSAVSQAQATSQSRRPN